MKNVWRYVLAVVLCEAVGMVGSLFTMNAIPTWYAHLAKPSFSPPNWLFGPVWTLLYALMGIAFVLVYQKRKDKHEKLQAEEWFFVQLLLNAIWTPIFFGWHATAPALIILLALWVAIAGTILRFEHISKLAAWLLVPYISWVSFATVLNFALWRMN